MATDTRDTLLVVCARCGQKFDPSVGWYFNTKECLKCHDKEAQKKTRD